MGSPTPHRAPGHPKKGRAPPEIPPGHSWVGIFLHPKNTQSPPAPQPAPPKALVVRGIIRKGLISRADELLCLSMTFISWEFQQSLPCTRQQQEEGKKAQEMGTCSRKKFFLNFFFSNYDFAACERHRKELWGRLSTNPKKKNPSLLSLSSPCWQGRPRALKVPKNEFQGC